MSCHNNKNKNETDQEAILYTHKKRARPKNRRTGEQGEEEILRLWVVCEGNLVEKRRGKKEVSKKREYI